MSSIIFNESRSMGNATNDRHVAVSREQVESLADFVRRVRNEKGLSLLDVERKARQAGYEIAGSYVNRIENEIADSAGVTPKKLIALAAGLGVSEDEIFAIARGKTTSGDLQLDELRLVEYFRTLPQDSREVLLAYAEMMSIRAGGKGKRIPLEMAEVKTTPQREKKRA